jgi:hypothetical protein
LLDATEDDVGAESEAVAFRLSRLVVVALGLGRLRRSSFQLGADGPVRVDASSSGAAIERR